MVAEDKRGLRVITVFAGSPARAPGIAAGDMIVAVDGTLAGGQERRAELDRADQGAGRDRRARCAVVHDGKRRAA